jgi:hypothetical protein
VELALLEQGAAETPLDLSSVATRVGMSRSSFAMLAFFIPRPMSGIFTSAVAIGRMYLPPRTRASNANVASRTKSDPRMITGMRTKMLTADAHATR